MTVRDDWREYYCSHKGDAFKCFQNLCNLRNSGRKRTQTFLCMPDQSRTPKIAALVFCPLPENRTRELMHEELGATMENSSSEESEKAKKYICGGRLEFKQGPHIR